MKFTKIPGDCISGKIETENAINAGMVYEVRPWPSHGRATRHAFCKHRPWSKIADQANYFVYNIRDNEPVFPRGN